MHLSLRTFYFAIEPDGNLASSLRVFPPNQFDALPARKNTARNTVLSVYNDRTRDSRRRAISPGDVPGGKVTGAPMRTAISPKRARRRRSRFIFHTPSRRIGKIGMRRFSANSPMPDSNDAMQPSSALLTS